MRNVPRALAQQAWEAFRNAQMALLHPDDGKSRGSVEPMCTCHERAALTRARTEELRYMLRPMEGDVCGWVP